MREFESIGDDSLSNVPDRIAEWLREEYAPRREFHLGPGEMIECSTHCPTCNYGPLDGATAVSCNDPAERTKPVAGDKSICGRCGEFLSYEDREGMLVLRKASPEDLTALLEMEGGDVIFETMKHRRRDWERKRGE